jgi:hypothetical protein
MKGLGLINSPPRHSPSKMPGARGKESGELIRLADVPQAVAIDEKPAG